MEEYFEIISRLTTAEIADNVLTALSKSHFVEYIDPHYHLDLIKADPDDNKFVDCAFAANATYIVSNDSHFDVLKSIKFPKVQVLKLIEFLQTLHD